MKNGIWGVLLLGSMLALSACNAEENDMNKEQMNGGDNAHAQSEMNSNTAEEETGGTETEMKDGEMSEEGMKDEEMGGTKTEMKDAEMDGGDKKDEGEERKMNEGM